MVPGPQEEASASPGTLMLAKSDGLGRSLLLDPDWASVHRTPKPGVAGSSPATPASFADIAVEWAHKSLPSLPQASDKSCEPGLGLTARPGRYRKPHRLRPGNGLPRRTSPKTGSFAGPVLKGWGGEYLFEVANSEASTSKPWPSSARSSFCRKCAPRPTRSPGRRAARPLITTIMVFVMVAVASVFFLSPIRSSGSSSPSFSAIAG